MTLMSDKKCNRKAIRPLFMHLQHAIFSLLSVLFSQCVHICSITLHYNIITQIYNVRKIFWTNIIKEPNLSCSALHISEEHVELAGNTLSFSVSVQVLLCLVVYVLSHVLSPCQCRFVKSVMWEQKWVATLENYTLSMLAKHIKCINTTKVSGENVLLEVFWVYCMAFGGSFFKLVWSNLLFIQAINNP